MQLLEATCVQLSSHRCSVLQVECQPAGNIVVSIDVARLPGNLTLHLLQLAGSAGLTSVQVQSDLQVGLCELSPVAHGEVPLLLPCSVLSPARLLHNDLSGHEVIPGGCSTAQEPGSSSRTSRGPLGARLLCWALVPLICTSLASRGRHCCSGDFVKLRHPTLLLHHCPPAVLIHAHVVNAGSCSYPCTCGNCRQAVPAPPFTGAVTTSQQFPLTNASAQPMFLTGQGGMIGVDPAALAAAVLPTASAPAPAPSGGVINVQAFSGPLSASAGGPNSSCETHAAPQA